MLFSLKIGSSVGLIIGGLLQFMFPDFIGLFGGAMKSSIEHRELIAEIALIGGLILFYMPTDLTK